jgi:serine/threonine-protein kinase HipA
LSVFAVGRPSEKANDLQMKLATSLGSKNHNRISEVQGQHFAQTAEPANVPKRLVADAITSVADLATTALNSTESELPDDFPEYIHTSVKAAVVERLRFLKLQ